MSAVQLFGTKQDEPEDLVASMNFDDLDITNVTENINFEEIDGLMEKFKEDPRVQEILEQGLDVREYSQNIERMLETAEQNSINDYVSQQQSLANLHEEILSCDSILESMESILHRFQFDLGNISDSIRYLQDQSSTMSIKLQNRKAVADDLHGFIENITLPKKLVKYECTVCHVNEAYLEFLTALNQKILFSQQQGKQILATKDIDPELEKLRIKAVAKVREHMLHTIYTDLRKPNTNVQLQQQAQLSNLKKFNEFLLRYGREHAKEVRLAYIGTMQKIYFNHFREYIGGLMKFETEIGSKNDLLGVEENQGKGFFSSRFAKNRSNVFSMGVPSRGLILEDLEDNCIILHDAQTKKQTFSYEVLFRSMMFYFKSAVESENSFDSEFFCQKVDLYDKIFGRASVLFTDNVTNYVSSSFDAIGLLIMMRISKYYADQSREQEISKLAAFFDNISEILRPRFFSVFALHLESIRNADPRVLGFPDPSKDGGLGPHYVVRRYAEFISAIHSLNPENNQTITTRLAALRTQMQKLLLRLAAPLQNIPRSSPLQCKHKQVVFLINNVDQILSVLSNRKLFVEDGEKWKASLEQQIGNLVEVELLTHFDVLVRFVKTLTKAAEQNSIQWSNGTTAKALEVTRQIDQSFAQNVERIIADIRKWITNLLSGADILQNTLTALNNYYSQLEAFVRKNTNDQAVLNEVSVLGAKISHHIKKCKIL